MSNKINEYISDGVSHPGETLLEKLEDMEMTQSELSLRMGRPRKTINEIIKGKIAITPETALQLEMVLDVPASFWNKRERDYQEARAAQEQKQRLQDWSEWLEKIPYAELMQKGWIPFVKEQAEIVRAVLAFFGVVSPEQWEALWSNRLNTAFRRSNNFLVDEASVVAWLRKAELMASEIECAPYDEKLFRNILREVRSLTTELPTPELYQSKISEICRTAGVAVIVLPKLDQARVFGASQWLSPRKAMIVLSLYHSTDDIFWFNFFHEAGHILLHSKKETHIAVDDKTYATAQVEVEANQFAREFLIPTEQLLTFVRSRNKTKTGDVFIGPEDVCQFAKDVGVSPSTVVGRLQYDKWLKNKYNNKLKTYLEWNQDGSLSIKRMPEECE